MRIKAILLVCLMMIGINATASLYDISERSHLPSDPKELYIDLMKKILANTIYEDDAYDGPYNSRRRAEGLDWPSKAHTMIGAARLNNIHFCLQQILQNNIPGDCIETGVWRGGATILMRAILKAYGDTQRKVWVVDSFEGLPPPNADKYPHDAGLRFCDYPVLAVSLEQVQANFKKYELLDNQVVFLKGLFSDTLPTAPIQQISLLRLDGDLYESTMDALTNLYPKLSVGGYVIIDDYNAVWQSAVALHDYRAMFHITSPLIPIDSTSVYFQKTE